MAWRRPTRLTNLELVLVMVVVIAVTAPSALLIRDVLTARTLPAGCIEADKTLPGCRPIGRPIAQNLLPIAAIVLAPLSALLAALITARTADDRQALALIDQREQLEKQIGAENARHSHGLALQREKHELEEIRRVLDGAVEAVMRTTDDVLAVKAAWSSSHHSHEGDTEWSGLRADASQSVSHLAGFWYRVAMRLGDEHSASVALGETVRAFRDYLDSMRLDETRELRSDSLASAEERVRTEVTRFRDAATSEVAVRRDGLEEAATTTS
jgi:hypothetical protein